MQELAWELAGMAGPDGELDRRVRASLLMVPRAVELEGNALLYTMDRAQEKRPGPGLLQRFVNLEEPPTILAYARVWGALMICEHDRPYSHNPPPDNIGGYQGPQYWCQPLLHPGSFEHYEPLGAWRHFSRAARGILNIAARLYYDGKPGDPADWQAIYARSRRSAPWWGQRPDAEGLILERGILSRVVTEWLRIGDVRPRMRREGELLALELGGRGLFGAVALQLAMATCRAAGWAVCSGCGQMYARQQRAPRRGQPNYCQDCGPRAAGRVRMRRLRARRQTKGA